MTASGDRWAQISQLFEVARALPAEDRQAFIVKACGSDLSLQHEVQELLAQPTSPHDLAALAPSAVARVLALQPRGALAGARFGVYVLRQFIGQGGMGDVYRAVDTKLGREVAVKVLPPEFSNDPERVRRFELEARTLAALNHPHIATIHGIEEGTAGNAIVMELVEGETLAEHLLRGPLPVRTALEYARQVAEALEASHEQGIVHRDLKPANVKVTADGVVKVLDFGLAKSVARMVHSESTPTVTVDLTVKGTVLGTPAYMSPEQLRGQAVDRRADIWAFGCVLYEMLSGRAPFSKPTMAETQAAILESDPNLGGLPRLPPAVRQLLTRCFDKDPRRRLRDIGEARLVTEESLRAGSPRDGWQRHTRVVVATGAVIVGIAAFALLSQRRESATAPPAGTVRTLVAIAPADAFGPGPTRISAGFPYPTRTDLALSPDGATLVFSAVQAGRQQLYRRKLNALTATPIAGTENSNSPFFSRDGQWLGFWVGVAEPGEIGELKKVRLEGGPAVTLARVAPLRGATWGSSDIIFATIEGSARLWKVPAAGGIPQRLTLENDDVGSEVVHRLPHLLPDGQHVLFTTGAPALGFADGRTSVLSLETGEIRTVLQSGIDARYVKSGHLVYVHDGVLMAVAFDPDAQQVSGPPIALVQGVMQAVGTTNLSSSETGAAQFSVSETGALVYVPSVPLAARQQSLMWVDRDGGVMPIEAPLKGYGGPRVSPDGGRIAVHAEGRLWIYERGREVLTQLAPGPEIFWPSWKPDGKLITIVQGSDFVSLSLDGREVERMSASSGIHPAGSWSPNGRTLLFAKLVENGVWEIRAISPPEPERKLRPVSSTPVSERYPQFSPDGQWFVYASNQSGRDEVWLERYGAGERHQISSEGGTAPVWSPDGRRLFYAIATAAGRLRMMAVDVTLAPVFSAGVPRALFEGAFAIGTPHRHYDVAPDGRFIMLQEQERPPAPLVTQLVLVSNWFEELRQLAPRQP